MKIERIEIYGFGKWIDATFDFSEQMLTCLYGENEAGKSTLQQFLLYMFFGFPPKLRNLFRPKQSNRIGGMLTIADEEIGTYTIERVEDEIHCYLPSGETFGEQFLQERLKGLTKEIYTSIYSFSALDLQMIRQMKGEDLSDVLFSVGLTGATSIYQVEKQLEKELGELYKKTGRKPLINQQIKKVSDLYTTLQKDRTLERSYQEKIETKEKLENETMNIEEKVRLLKEKLLKLERLKQAYPLLKEYALFEKKLLDYPDTIPFPEDGINRYEMLKRQMLPLKSDLKMLQKAEKEYDTKINEIKDKLYSEEVLKRGEDIINEYHQVQVRDEKIADFQTELRKLDETLNDMLQSVSLTEEEVKAIHLPFHLKKKWETISETNDVLQIESEKLTNDHQVLYEEFARLQKEEEKIKKEMLPEEELAELKEKVDRFTVLQAEQKQKEQLFAWHKNHQKQNRNIFIGASILAIISCIIAFLVEDVVIFTFTALFIFIALWQFVLLKNTTKEIKKQEVEKVVAIPHEERRGLEQLFNEQRQLEAELQVIKNEQKRLHLHQLQLEERKKLFEQNESKWMEQIHEEQRQYPFLKQTEPAYWAELLELLHKIKNHLKDKQQMLHQIHLLKEHNRKFFDAVLRFSEMLNEERLSIEEIKELLEEQRSHLQLLTQYRKLLEENRANQKQLFEQISVYEIEIAQLFEIAGVADEEEFFQQSNQLAEKNKLLEQKDSIIQQLYLTIHEEELNQVLKESINEDEISLNIEQIQEEIKALEEEKDFKNKQLAQLQIEIQQLEMSDDISKTAYLFEMEKEKLNQLAKKWAIRKYAQTALAQAKQSYQQKYLHEVIAYTTKYFTRLTNGKYQNVFAPTDTQLFQVEAESNIRYTVEELSKGTIDQLYISLRLAISKVMSDKFVVPIIIDDAFVHFDDRRTEEMIDILKEIAKERQILLFTCKKQIANLFEQKMLKKLKEVV